MTEPNFPRLASWMADQLAARDWSVTDLANQSGLNRSGIQRWKSGTLRPDIDNARRLADAFGRPLLEVLVAADILTEEEAKLRTTTADPSTLTNEQILVELSRRLDTADGRAKPTAEDVAADPDRYAPVGRRNRTESGHVRSVKAR